VAVYVLVAIVRKRLGIEAPLYTFLQVLSLTLFEKMPIFQAFSSLPNETGARYTTLLRRGAIWIRFEDSRPKGSSRCSIVFSPLFSRRYARIFP
jgi:hypothetical protein